MYWLYYAFISIILMGVFNLYLEGTKTSIPKGFHNKHMYLCCILVTAGLLSLCLLLYYRIAYSKEFITFFKKDITFPYFHVIIPALLIISYMITNMLALNKGGGVAMGMIGLNMFVVLIGGALMFNDKIDYKIIIAMLVGICAIAFAAMESYRLNKKS